MKKEAIKVLIVDNHELIRCGIRCALSNSPGITIVGEAVSGEEAISLVRSLNPEIVLMEFNMPAAKGVEIIKKIQRFHPEVKILILSAFEDNFFPQRLLEVGVWGYIAKSEKADELAKAILDTHEGKRYISPKVAQKICLEGITNSCKLIFDSLTTRELQITMMITKGIDNKKIAKTLGISAKTVNTFRYRIRKKLKVKNDVELAYLTMEHHLMDIDK